MQRLHYIKDSQRLAKLHDALLAAGITPTRVEGLAQDIWLTVPDGVLPADVDAVVTAYDPTTPGPVEQEQINRQAALDQLISQADSVIANWATLTAAQKDTVLLRLVRAVRALARWARSQ